MDQAEKLRNIIKGQKNERKRFARVITVTSGKGGVGKSSISINLAIQLSKAGKRVIILDADFGLANIEIMLGLRPKYNLADLMFHGKTLQDIITVGPADIGFISGGSGIRELSNLTRDQVITLVQMLYELDSMADVIIIDTGAGISDAVLEFVISSLEIILVVTPEPTSITDAYALLKTLNKKSGFTRDKTKIHVIGNRIQREKEGRDLFEKLSAVVGKFLNIELELLGLVPYDPYCQKSVMRQWPVSLEYPNALSSRALREIALLLDDKKINNNIEKRGIGQIFTSLIRNKFHK